MKKMKRRFLALLLCVAMLLNVSPTIPAQASSSELLTVMYDGDPVDSVVLPVNERIKLKADRALLGSGTYQWQILAYDTFWVDIAGAEGKTVEISYAMIANLLQNDEAVVRCKVTKGENVTYSSEVIVEVDYDVATDSNAIEIEEESPSNARVASGSNADEDDEEVTTEPAKVSRVFNLLRRAVEGGTDETSTYSLGTKYNVVINYLFENNQIAAESYTATLEEGSDFHATVISPTIQGYLPYILEEDEYVAADKVELNYQKIQRGYEINVFYRPTSVDYTVNHYKQNVDDDEYTKAESETKTGLTNNIVPEVAKVYKNADNTLHTEAGYEGFYALLYERPAIAADGSTVVDIYYDRYYYLMNFDLDGGYGVEPIYARYGATINDVGTPTKAGYSFVGWSLDEGDPTKDLPTTMPAENRTYKAVWQVNAAAKVTVVFWGENANDEEYSYIKSMDVSRTPGETFAVDGTQYLHEHTKSCYGDNVGNEVNTKRYTILGNEINGYIGEYGTSSWGGEFQRRGNCIYINNTWYIYTGTLTTGSIAEAICDSLDSNLWSFKESDIVIVSADGSSVVNVYYDRTEKTLTFKYDYSEPTLWWDEGSYNKTETITAKWGADISTKYKIIAENADSTFWSAETDGSGPYTNYFGIMPQSSATYYNQGTIGSEGTMTYWGQDLNGEYTVKLFEVTGVGGYYVSDEDRYEFQGFTYDHGAENKSNCAGAAFYYTRNSYILTFNDGYNDVKSETVKFEAPLSTYDRYVPKVPSAKESGSVVFGGWYLNPECTGYEYILNEHTMPAKNVLLYAKWVPVTHTVEFYLDKVAYDSKRKLSSHSDIFVPHGTIADPTPDIPENGSYSFVGWFYEDNGVEKAFDFANMPVNKDLKVYGKWSSNVLREYTIYYKIKDTDTQIADPTKGSGLASTTKTFEAKGGSELYETYQEGYFPTYKSHSLTLDIENDANNEYTFWYIPAPAVPYKVKYWIQKEDGTTEPAFVNEDGTEYIYENKENHKAVVTETFKVKSGYLPDAYQKRLVVSVNEDGTPNEEENVIIFYYTKDETHAYYKITHNIQNLDGETWTEYSSVVAKGEIGTPYTEKPIDISGFEYNKIEYVVSGKTVEEADITDQGVGLTAEGLEINLYYVRKEYPYQVRYLEQGTDQKLADPKNANGKFGQVISESAISIGGYEPIAPTSKEITIRIETGDTAENNIIIFYYKEKRATIKYEVVGPDGSGTLTSESETVAVFSDAAVGSTASPTSATYRFVGWYTDSACTNPVDGKWINNAAIVPQKNHNYAPNGVAEKLGYSDVTYYAKFEYALADLKIQKRGADPNDTFIFNVTGGGINTTVVVKGNHHVILKDLPAGNVYTVTEDINWSWRYKLSSVSAPDDSNSEKVENGIKFTLLKYDSGEATVTFTNGKDSDKNKWIDGSDRKKNIFRPTTVTSSQSE